jgi:hypothetical protein
VVLEFELWVLLSLESVWGCGCGFDFDLVLRPLDLKNPILLSLGLGIWYWCLSAWRLVSFLRYWSLRLRRGVVWFGFGFGMGGI